MSKFVNDKGTIRELVKNGSKAHTPGSMLRLLRRQERAIAKSKARIESLEGSMLHMNKYADEDTYTDAWVRQITGKALQEGG